MKRKSVAMLFFCCLAATGLVRAQEQEGSAPTYAIMSLVGDNYLVLNYQRFIDTGCPSTGANANLPGSCTFPIADDTYDNVAVNAIGDAVMQRYPDAKLDMLLTRNAKLFVQQDRLFDAKDRATPIRESLLALLKERKADYLILVTKRRSNRDLLEASDLLPPASSMFQIDVRGTARTGSRLGSASGGSRWLEGMGFFVTGATSLPYNLRGRLLLSYLDATVRLIDAKTLNVIREVPFTRLGLTGVVDFTEDRMYVWEDATEAQKISSLQNTIRMSLTEATPKLLSAMPARVSQARPAEQSVH